MYWTTASRPPQARVVLPFSKHHHRSRPYKYIRIKVKFTGLTQNSQVDPAVGLKIPIRAFELTQILGQILGQSCQF